MSKGSDIEVVVKAIDEFSATLKSFQGYVKGIGDSSDKTAGQVKTLGDRFSGLGAVLTGALMKAGADIFEALKNGLTSVIELIPSAYEQGYQWVEMVQQMQVETGMTAEQTSSLAAVMREMGVPVENMDRLFAMFGKNLATNEALFTSLGIATRDANGQFLDAYTIINETRQAFAAHGDALSKTAAAQQLFSRSGYEMLQFLNLTDDQFRQLTQDAGAAGMVLSQGTLDAAHRFGIEMNRLGDIITGVQSSIFAGLEPSLESFVDSFGNFIEANLNTIVGFVVQVANFVMGLIGGIFGVDFGAQTVAGGLGGPGGESGSTGETGRGQDTAPVKSKSVGGGGGGGGGGSKSNDAYTKSINAQIKAIDNQIAALDKLNSAQDAAKQQATLQQAIADAQTELSDLQKSQVNTYGLSNAERIKAEQKHAADLVLAQKKVTDAQKGMTDFTAQQDKAAAKAKLEAEKQALQDQLAAHQQVAGGITKGYKATAAAVGSTFTALDKTLSSGLKDFSKQASDGMKDGKKAAEDLKTAIDNACTAIGTFVGLISDLIKPLQTLNNLLAPAGGLPGLLEFMISPLAWFMDHDTPIRQFFNALVDKIRDFLGLSAKENVGAGPIGHHAAGAIVSQPELAWIGEGGEPEAIIPKHLWPALRPSGPSFGSREVTHIDLVIDGYRFRQLLNKNMGRLMLEHPNKP